MCPLFSSLINIMSNVSLYTYNQYYEQHHVIKVTRCDKRSAEKINSIKPVWNARGFREVHVAIYIYN